MWRTKVDAGTSIYLLLIVEYCVYRILRAPRTYDKSNHRSTCWVPRLFRCRTDSHKRGDQRTYIRSTWELMTGQQWRMSPTRPTPTMAWSRTSWLSTESTRMYYRSGTDWCTPHHHLIIIITWICYPPSIAQRRRTMYRYIGVRAIFSREGWAIFAQKIFRHRPKNCKPAKLLCPNHPTQ